MGQQRPLAESPLAIRYRMHEVNSAEFEIARSARHETQVALSIIC